MDLLRPQRILIVEDSVGFAVSLAKFLREMGHDVWVVAGIDEVAAAEATGISIDLRSPAKVPVAVDLAFLDHFFLSRRLDGTLLTRELVLHGVPKIVAMSSDESANRRMMKEGATMALRKSDLARMLGL